MIGDQVIQAIHSLARSPVVVVACDYDGTLAPIVDDPAAAFPHRESIAALRALAVLPDTHVALISGRSLEDLARLSRLPAEVHLVGSHGSEFDLSFARALPDEAVELRNRVTAELEAIASRTPGAIVERKPAGVAFHVRQAQEADAKSALEEVVAGAGSQSGVHVKFGKKVVELSVVGTDKGQALERIRSAYSADAVVFVGDDITDEDAFTVLRGSDVGIKVGEGPSVATLRIDDVDDVAQVLAVLEEARREWIEGEGAEPIESHSFLSDLHTFALIEHDARISWMCYPRPDSPSVFAHLLGGTTAGSFVVQPAIATEVPVQRYLPDSLVVETRWPTISVFDYLDRSHHDDDAATGSKLIRQIEGTGRVRIEFSPRLDFGRAPTRFVPIPDGFELAGTGERIRLYAPNVEWEIVDDGLHHTAVGEVDLTGDCVTLVMQFGGDDESNPLVWATESERRAKTVTTWNEWVGRLTLPSLATSAVSRSALTLKGLCHEPSGAIAAAATTSLPEVIGGVRNWDYRLCWPRDGALTSSSLLSLGSSSEAIAFLGWLIDRIEHLPSPEQLRPVYPLVGDEYLPEAVIPTLHGYRNSRPVRIGNAAEHQVQLDVFGPIVDLVDRLATRGHSYTPQWWSLVEHMASAVERRWHEPDQGIWEERRPPRHHVHSKVMCWLTIDRAISIARQWGQPVSQNWIDLRGTIASDVLENGWNPLVGAFTIAYGDVELDAAALFVGLSGLVAPDDPKFIATVERVERELRDGSATYRYRLDDGLPGTEGGFHLCTSWLVRAHVLMGNKEHAEMLFEQLISLVGPTGLLSEQYDPVNKMGLGNFPQAYSHLGIIDAALALEALH